MIVIGICSWIPDEAQVPELVRCLESVKDYRVIVVDGRWYDIDSPHDVSCLKAFETYQSYPNVEVIVSIGAHEWENRNIYYAKCSDDDSLIVLDTDEWIEWTGELEFDITKDSFHVEGHDKRIGGRCVLNRGIVHPAQTRHKDRHNKLFTNGKVLEYESRASGILIHHDKSHRTDEHKELMSVRANKKEFR